ncbi:MAG: dihydroorotate dehydrogenase (quinone) [Candidatus Pacebacteria bacterium]|nr:dihydroorotate dehydrogenase (quinone) [Candidatus Paceibacterota bacterium]PIR60978.1 MAG: dihydroorotate dehydrogenase (quinone) [Candidatus Pacebacteria bacterium CG10_big_fil_rev_8_21_14_0_10_45_6]
MQLLISLLLVSLSLIGIADSSYISWYEWQRIVPECGGNFDCGTVLSSPWAHIGPLPIAYLGLAYYLTVFVVGLLHVIDMEEGVISKKLQKYRVTPIEILWLLTLLGFVFSLYLISIMAFAIGEWCKYCLVSAATSSSLFIVSSLYLKFFLKRPALFIRKLLQIKLRFLYQHLVKPVCFLMDAEVVHTKIVRVGEMLGKTKPGQFLTKLLFAVSDKKLEIKLAGITFPNRVGLSAGFDYNGQLTGILPAVGFGWHTIGTITLEPYAGNTKPQLGRFPDSKALLVNKGLKNIGAQGIIDKLSQLPFAIPTGISIASTNKSFGSTRAQILDMLQCFWLFEHSKVEHKYYELNISCPNTFDGEPFTTADRLEILLSAIDDLQLSRPMFLKMPIDQGERETKALLTVADKHKVAGIIFGNLTKDKQNPAVTKADRERWSTLRGNLSGKPTWERSNKLIALTRKEFGKRFVIIGTGGIFSATDAAEKIRLGADLVQLISGMIFQGPQLIGEINLEQCYNTP